MPITDLAVTPAGQLVLTHALRHAWAAGDLDDVAVHELSLAAGLVREHAIVPACAQWDHPSHPWCIAGEPCRFLVGDLA